MSKQRNGVDDIIIEPSPEDVREMLAEIRPILDGRRATCKQSPHQFTVVPGAVARISVYIDRTRIHITVISMNGQNLLELSVPIPTNKLAADTQALVSLFAKILRLCNILAIAKKMARRDPAFSNATSSQCAIHIDVPYGHLRMYQVNGDICIEEHPDKVGHRKNIHRFPVETLLYGKLTPDPRDKKKLRMTKHYLDASLVACIDRVRFPDPNAEPPAVPVHRGSPHAVPAATQQ